METSATATPAAPPPAAPRVAARRVLRLPRAAAVEVGCAIAAALLALAAAAWVLRLWRGDLSVPFSNQFDALQHAMLVKGVLEHGWYSVNDSLGAPFGQELYDFPQNGDNLQLLIIKGLGFFTHDFAVVLNLYFLLTFPLVALAAYVVLRRLGASIAVATVCAVLYALLPYHFARRELHLFLSGYYAVPLGAYLVLATFSGTPLFTRRPEGARPRWASRRTLLTLAACAVLGSASVYYAGFTGVLLLAAGVVVLFARRDGRALKGAFGAIAAIAAVLAINFIPVALDKIDHGGNSEVAHRRAEESERYALRFSQLVLPVNDHRLGFLARAKRRYVLTSKTSNPFNESYSAALGLVATIGFLWLLLVALLTLVASARRMSIDERFRHASAGTVIAFLVATVGGVSTLINYWITPQLRAWNRMSVFIAFFSFVAVALLLDKLRRRMGSAPGRRVLFGAALAVVLVMGVLDQTTQRDVPAYRANAAQFHSDGDLVARIERVLPRGAMVFALPYMGFPESKPIHRMTNYDQVRGYLHSHHLRWSYGAMQGRPADWSEDLADKPVSLVAPGVAAAGFDGVWVDRFGFADGGHAVTVALGTIAGVAPLRSPNRRLEFFDLRPYAAALRSRHSPAQLRALRDATLEPALATTWGPGFGRLHQAARHSFRALAPQASLRVVNRRGLRPGTLTATVRARVPARLTVRYPTGVQQAVLVTPRGATLRRLLQLRSGTSTIRFAATPVDPRTPAAALGLRLEDPAVLEPGFVPFL
jgi:phosphoglycerol transferase